MIEILIVAALIAAIGIKITSKDRFRSIGATKGVCKEVRVELSPRYRKTERLDRIMYRPYIEYEWEGNTYIAKSYRAYSVARIFPGDQVSIFVNERDKNIVKIL